MLSGGAAASSEGTEPPAKTLNQPNTNQTHGADVAVGAPDAAFETFLDRLMRAESNGIAHAKNPRSSALGPFQFINSTFLAVMRQHFPGDIAKLSEQQILALRTKHEVARRAAKAFSKDNMNYLMARGITPTFGHLRLAFLLGPEGAARVLKAPPERALTRVLEGGVIAANPFMRRMTAADLVARATRDVSPRPGEPAPPSATIVAEAAPVAPAPVPADPAKAEPAPAEQPAQVAEAAAPKAEPEPTAEARAEPQPTAEAEMQAVAVAAPAKSEPEPKAETKTEAVAEAKAPEAGETPTAAPETKVAEAPEAKVAEDDAKAAPRTGRITARRLDRQAVINVTCDDRIPSCRRWINREIAKLIQVAEN